MLGFSLISLDLILSSAMCEGCGLFWWVLMCIRVGCFGLSFVSSLALACRGSEMCLDELCTARESVEKGVCVFRFAIGAFLVVSTIFERFCER